MSDATSSISLHDTWGVYFIGVVLGAGLWGTGCVQMYYYYETYRRDIIYLKLLVAIVFILDTIQIIFQAMIAYFVLVKKYAQPEFLISTVSLTHYGLVWILLSGISISLVQSFYVTRIWQLSGNNHYIAAILFLVIAGELSVTTAYFSRIYRMSSVLQWLDITWLGKMINAFEASSSVLITALVIYYLQGSRTGFKKTETMINRLILFAVNTGLLTSIDTALSLIFLIVMPGNFVYILFYGLVSKLYFNSFIATLNSRNKVREAAAKASQEGATFSSVLERRTQPSHPVKPIAINIVSESRTIADMDQESGRFKF